MIYNTEAIRTLNKPPVKLALVSLDGNAFALMGAFQRQARKEGWSGTQTSAVLSECQSGDYDHLLQTLLTWCADPNSDLCPLCNESPDGSASVTKRMSMKNRPK